MAELTHERVCELLEYNPKTGYLIRMITRGNVRAGTIAGSAKLFRNKWYRRVCVDGIVYMEHRIIKFIVDGSWPTCAVDHIDGNGLNNAWSNLRDATCSQNSSNSKLRYTNSTGFKGVSWHKGTKKWCATIGINGQFIWIGLFADIHEAAAAYARAAIHHFGEFANMPNHQRELVVK